MSHAEKCPICYGSGILRWIDGVELTGIVLDGQSEKQCHGCDGKGWLCVPDEVVQEDILGKYHLLSKHSGTFPLNSETS